MQKMNWCGKVALESKECVILKLLKFYFFKYTYESQCLD